MTAEAVYERHASDLEHRFLGALEREARAGLAAAAAEGYGDDRDYRRDRAVDFVEKFCFEADVFQTVKATDISDIACEIADRVEREEWL